MFCTKCGNKLEDGAVFCDECGVKIERQQQPAVAQNQNFQTQQSQSSPAGEALNNAFNTAKQKIDQLGLGGWQITFCILTALSALFSLITCNLIYNWVTMMCAGFLLFLCIKKEPYNTVLTALPITVYSAKELIWYVFVKIPNFKYYSGFSVLFGIIFFTLDILIIVGYWLIVTNKALSCKKIFLWIIVGTISLNLLGILANFFMGYIFRFQTIVYYLSMGLFLVTYLLMIIRSEKDYMFRK